MKRTNIVRALFAGSALFVSTAALAQDPAPQPAPQAEPDQSDATANATIAQTKDLDDAQAKIELLQAQVEALQESIAQIQAQVTKVTPSWKGAPQLEDKEAGWSFKPKGLIQYDAGYTGFPRGDQLRGTIIGIGQNGVQTAGSGLNYGNLGWDTRARRLTIGAEGSIPGGFRYSAEFNFVQGSIDYEDVYLAYDFKKAPLTAQIGYFYPFSSLETMTSSKYTSFMERAAFTDGFNDNRRIGAALIANDKVADTWIAQAGIFSQQMNNNDFNRTGFVLAARGVYSPMLGTTRLHLGANFEYRVNTKEVMGTNYQARPTTQLTDQRFVSTGNLAAKGDAIAGVELAAIHKSLHFAGEAQKLWVRDALSQSEINDINSNLDSNNTPTGAALNGNPSFWAGYAEIGYFLTGETRAYKGGAFGRVKVLHPFNEGGWGAIQINGRVDYLDLSDRVANSPTFGTPFYVNGGKQTAYQASLIWNPTDYVRFMAQYAYVHVKGGPRPSISTVANPTLQSQLGMFPFDPTPEQVNERTFSSSVAAVRAQLDF